MGGRDLPKEGKGQGWKKQGENTAPPPATIPFFLYRFTTEERHRWHQRVRTFIRKFTNTRPTCTLLISHRCSFVRSSSTTTQQRAAAPTIEVASFAHVPSHRSIPATAQFHCFPSFLLHLLPFPLVPLRLGSTSVHPLPHLSTYRTFHRVRPCSMLMLVCLCMSIREHRVLRELHPSPVEFKLTLTHISVHVHHTSTFSSTY